MSYFPWQALRLRGRNRADRAGRRHRSPGDAHAQAVRCLDIAEQALHEAGAALTDVARTRVMLTDITQWKQAAGAHAERFAQVATNYSATPVAQTMPGNGNQIQPHTRVRSSASDDMHSTVIGVVVHSADLGPAVVWHAIRLGVWVASSTHRQTVTDSP